MNYPNGEKIKVGDTLKLWADCLGVVVCSLDDNEFTKNYSRDDWAYLNEGVLINSDSAGLIHYTEPEKTFLLISRAYEEKPSCM